MAQGFNWIYLFFDRQSLRLWRWWNVSTRSVNFISCSAPQPTPQTPHTLPSYPKPLLCLELEHPQWCLLLFHIGPTSLCPPVWHHRLVLTFRPPNWWRWWITSVHKREHGKRELEKKTTEPASKSCLFLGKRQTESCFPDLKFLCWSLKIFFTLNLQTQSEATSMKLLKMPFRLSE